MSSHEFIQSPLYGWGWVPRKDRRVISAEPFFHSVRHELLFGYTKKFALLG
ncbi:MAG: hypothetical protein JO334_13930 [Verrucomicrobia bacterium]|nr:hypothetical protein [Verrucomicrobiota bacterium]